MSALSNLINSRANKLSPASLSRPSRLYGVEEEIVEATGLTPSPPKRSSPLSSASPKIVEATGLTPSPLRSGSSRKSSLRVYSPLEGADLSVRSERMGETKRTPILLPSLPTSLPTSLPAREKVSMPSPKLDRLASSTVQKKEDEEEVVFFSEGKSMMRYPILKISPVSFGSDTIDYQLDDAEYMPEIIANIHAKENSQDIYEFLKKYSLIPEDKFPLTNRDINNIYPTLITTTDRNKLVDWIYYVYQSYNKKLSLNYKILFSTLSCIDRCLLHPAFHNLQKDQLSLLAMTCMRLIAKLEGRRIDAALYLFIASDTLKMSAMNDMEMKILTNVGTFSELITFYTWHEILSVVLPEIILKVTLHLGIILEFYPEVFVNYLPSEIFAGLIYIALISYNYKWLDSLDSYLSVTELKAVEVAQYIYQLINEKRLIKNLQEYKVLLPELKVDIVSP